MKKILKRLLIGFLTIIVAAIVFLLITFPPIMAGMASKTTCSCVFVTGRTPESVVSQELKVFPGLGMARIELNYDDSTVEATFVGRMKKSIFRKGLGCVLLADLSEEYVRSQKINAPLLTPPVKLDTIDWPDGNKLEPSGADSLIDQILLSKTVDQAFTDINPEEPVRTHAVVVLYDGKIVAEKYAEGLDYKSRLKGWSMTKTVTQAMIGILVRDGELKVDDPAPIQEWQSDGRKKITIDNLLKANSGLAWSESYFSPYAKFHQMFSRSDDKAGYAATLELEHEPGTYFEYSSASTNLLSRIIRQTVGDENYYRFPYDRLLHRIGMHTAILEPDASGTFVGSSYGYASGRDWARFGLLYLRDGVWNGERILPEGWVKYSTTPSDAALKGEYGAQIWLNAGNKNNPEQCNYPGLPNDAFVFQGFEKNTVTVVPSHNLVVVRLGVTHNSNFDHVGLVNGVIAALPKQQ
jgi:CubicO group peptidase (beta-lactamase class C family)